ncbi:MULTISPECIES: PSD1 and planctomycete cytochrome C domain-containing protein [unclassified Cellulophaga]|uniref:PSD1 and planctomycete cytochrome C domain-containing protein n=1 Tax=unclassified Cellulophaga TaxID=2634405 RepID=UPI0026E20AE6|nr:MULTISPECIES: PSD1 and planctomycete cytochrome C domain-containing protein [unclassified Cellulophaga]MDO6492353.1 PSD1 and planctomycete cytochrome C domain-containing protein [Cellulophaga sp. 2_MG-2023]MDO6496147.1 PSD1 and planctomycete cytochrome C domain-containing protein [Cellulophaga sp. 3_MG-2023]
MILSNWFLYQKNNVAKIAFAVFITIGATSCKTENKYSEVAIAENGTAAIPDKIDFTFHVKPIISDRCFICHGPDKNAVEGNFSMVTPEEAYKALGENLDHYAIVPGDTEKSGMLDRIYSKDPGSIMPPPESNLILTEYEKEILKKWVEQGAEYKDHWAFTPPENQNVPKTKDTWGNNEIDNFIYQKLEENNLQPSEQAPKEKLLRRVYFDLTGLPPSTKDINNFLQDSSANAYEKVVDKLLESQDYAENMAAEWMDIARYADTHGYQDDFERIMWPWRDWVINAFNKNIPYNKFVTDQLAGDLIPDASLEQVLATGFNRNHKITYEGGVIPEEYRVEYVEDRITTFGTAFLGLTLECARCHDHKYDPISQKAHFSFFSFFNNIDEDGLVNGGSGVIPKPYITITEKEKNEVLDFVQLQKSDIKEVPVMVMQEMKTPRQAYILNRGLYDQHGEKVYPDTPKTILAYPEEFEKNRLGLAKWLFHKDNPLTARVAVNRFWQRMFGTGIVASSYDFGNQGALPTHPELLDYLALQFRDSDWDTKKMLKLMAMSKTYQQKTVISKEALEKDPENKWLARGPRIRLSAEMIRDQALFVSGLLNKEVGGPSVKPYQPEGIWEETTGGGGGSTSSYVLSEGKDLYRKSLYTFWKRTVPPPSMITFDAASRDLCSVKRQETNTPLQALVLLNDPQLIEAARVLASNAIKKETSIEKQISYIFQSSTSRLPDETEVTELTNHYNDMLNRVKSNEINTDEYLAIGSYKVDASIAVDNLAALSLTAHTILNLDETITKG